jgi:2,3-dihydroxybenzoate decarboxylase
MKVIALEEHYFDPEVTKHFTEGGPEARVAALRERLFDVGELRLKEMDQAGIDVQVLSHGAPATQRMDAETAVPVAKRANDRLHQVVQAHPDRFRGFAALPTADPKAAADELERTVTRLGFKGAMIHGLANGVFLDDRRFWPIFERAQALDVPVYMHPAVPHPAVADVYYRDYLKEFPGLLTAGWGSRATAPRRSATASASISGSPPAATSPPRRCCAACWRWAPTGSCSPWTTLSSSTRRA